jgi:hypothetical protein
MMKETAGQTAGTGEKKTELALVMMQTGREDF